MINSVALMGRLTATPELKKTSGGISVTSFAVAIDRTYSQQKQTDFLPCVAWRQSADFITTYFVKGDMIALTGEIQSRTYQDNRGVNRTAIEVQVNTASFCAGKANSQSGSNN